MLGIEINDGYIRLGFRKSGRLCGFTRMDAAVADGAILDRPSLRKQLADYAKANNPGKQTALTINTSQAIMRLTALPERRAEFDAAEAFPMDTSGCAVGWRAVGGETALACCIPGKISDSFAELVLEAGLMPVCIGLCADSVAIALERAENNAVCVMDRLLLYIENGRLTELAPLRDISAIELALSGLVIDRAYNLTENALADAALLRAGACEALPGDELALRGLLGVMK